MKYQNLATRSEIMNFYRDEILPILPPKVLDFHAHAWDSHNWNKVAWKTEQKGGRYMVTLEKYGPAKLFSDASRCFPEREYHAVCFGYPVPVVDWEKDTLFIAEASRRNKNLFPLMLAGKPLNISYEVYGEYLQKYGFYGFKVFLPWYGDDYGSITIQQMIGENEIRIANEKKLVILLHVPGKKRLADKKVQKGVIWLAKSCPNASIVLAHCGRCYLPSEIKDAINSIKNLANVYLDASMVMDPVVFQIIMNEIGTRRLFYATDFPVAAMCGRRVRVMDHWVDAVIPGYLESAYRIAGNIRAAPMAWEIILGIKWAACLAKITEKEIKAIFWENGFRILKAVKR